MLKLIFALKICLILSFLKWGEMMKVTLINGSARNNGSCSFILDSIIKTLSNDNEIVKYNISEMSINYCLGCKKCYSDGKCVQCDDVEMIVKDILSSDYVVIATPSYWADVPGQLKTFFDRNTPFGDANDKRILKANKLIKGIGIAVRAGKTQKENEIILDFLDHYYGHLGIMSVKRFSVTAVDKLDDLTKQEKTLNEICDYVLQMNS